LWGNHYRHGDSPSSDVHVVLELPGGETGQVDLLALIGGSMTILIAVALCAAVIALHQWWRFGVGRGAVAALYWLAFRAVAFAAAADHFRLVYHERLADREYPTPELVIHAVDGGVTKKAQDNPAAYWVRREHT
jgi:hypothetical protein